jgi:glucan 1,3-beta-glucosidase
MLFRTFLICSLSLLAVESRSLDYKIHDVEYDKIIRGVNLGGWLLLEPYITPSLFEAASNATLPANSSLYNISSGVPKDEYTYCQRLGYHECKKRLEGHWSSFYRRHDFFQMARFGLTHVRIPIGYWGFEAKRNDAFVQGQEKYLDDAIDWCREAGIRVWIDLQGLPGSQNGMPNSGRIKQTGWLNEGNQNLTLKVLDYISKKYGSDRYRDVVEAVQVVSEAIPGLMPLRLLYFYSDAYDTVRENSNLTVVFSDALAEMDTWEHLLLINGSTPYGNFYFDKHEYPALMPDLIRRPIENKVNAVCQEGMILKSSKLPVVVGEWSAALTDCAKYYNGVGVGHYFDGTIPNVPPGGDCDHQNDINQWTIDELNNHRRYVESQLEAWEQAGGWFFSNYKTEDAVSFDFVDLVKTGIIPFPLNQRKYPGICEYNSYNNTGSHNYNDTLGFNITQHF